LRVVVLAGGTGGAKLARGMLDLVGEDLSVVANTGDDIEIHGVHVSPDPDLVTYWLADEIDEEQGWGLRGDTYRAFERLVEQGSPRWFRLGDRDLAHCLRRTRLMQDGASLTKAQADLAIGLGIKARVLPMSEDRVQTRVLTSDGWRSFEEYFIRERSEPDIDGYEFAGASEAAPTPEVMAAVDDADLIVIGPSNPIASIGPILALRGMEEALHAAPAPVLAVSPFVGGRALKGPTEKFMRAAGLEASAAGAASLYEGMIDGLVADAGDPEEPVSPVPVLRVPTLMSGAEGRRALAEVVLEMGRELAPDL
jgi:LPPG:FO 2-phospho-L-lactate transferase